MFFIALLQIIEDAVSEIYEKYQKMMHHLAYSILRDYQLSEDAVSESLISLSQNLDKIDNINSDRSKNYIYTVTKNKSITMLSKQKSHDGVILFDFDELNNIEGEVDVKAFCDEYGFGSSVQEALSILNPLDRDIIIYRYGAGYTGREIAKLINKTPDFVYKRLQRATSQLEVFMRSEQNE